MKCGAGGSNPSDLGIAVGDDQEREDVAEFDRYIQRVKKFQGLCQNLLRG